MGGNGRAGQDKSAIHRIVVPAARVISLRPGLRRENSTAYAEAARQYREWSQRNWQQVTADRNASQDRKNFHVRENLGAIQTYVNPYDTRVPLELPTTYPYFWIDRQGNVLGTNDPSADLNSGSNAEWKQMQRHRP